MAPSRHDNNEINQARNLVNKLNSGDSIAIISDAGTPCISDPGYRVVNMAKKEEIEVPFLISFYLTDNQQLLIIHN